MGGLCLDCGVGGKHSLAAPLFSTSAHLHLPWASIQLQDLFANQQTREQTKSCVCTAVTSPAGGWGASRSSSGLWSTWHLGSGGMRATRLAVQVTLPSTPAVVTVGIRGRHGSHKLSTCPLPSSSRRPMWSTGHTLLPGVRAGNPFKELSRSLALPEQTARLVLLSLCSHREEAEARSCLQSLAAGLLRVPPWGRVFPFPAFPFRALTLCKAQDRYFLALSGPPPLLAISASAVFV